MIGPGLPDRVTLGRIGDTSNSRKIYSGGGFCIIIDSNNRKPQHWRLQQRAVSESRRALIAKTYGLTQFSCLHA